MPYILSAFADEAAPGLSEQMRICGENGIKWIEARGIDGKNISEISEKEAKAIRKQLDNEGFFISSIGSPFGKIGINDDFKPHLEAFKRTIEVSCILGAKYMRIFSFYIPKGENPENYSETVTERLSIFLENACGIALCHENEGGIFGQSAVRCKQLYDTLNGRMRLVFDPANFIQCGEDIESAYNMLHEAVEYFHIKDCLHDGTRVVPAGHGDGKIEWLINKFNEKGKSVFLSVEPHLFGQYDTEANAFSVAVMALKTILCINGYIQTKDFGKGYGEWIKIH